MGKTFRESPVDFEEKREKYGFPSFRRGQRAAKVIARRIDRKRKNRELRNEDIE